MEKTEQKGIIGRTYDWFKNLTVKGLLSVIAMAFIIMIILMSLSFVPSILSKITSSFSAALSSIFMPSESATMTIDKSIINSGDDAIINFKKGDMTNGLFTISYTCNSNVNLLSVEGSGLKNIDCDTTYYLLENETSIKIKPNTLDSVVRLAIEGSFENNQTQKTEKVGVVRLTIKNNSVSTPVSTPVTNRATTAPSTPVYTPPVYTPPAVQPVYYGKPDLAVRMLQTGLLITPTNLITPQSQFIYSDMVGIKFEVRNDGDAATGLWSFTATLPSISTPTYNSGTQISLRPGESIIFTLGFSNLSNLYSGLVTINIDSVNSVSESNEINNTITSTIINNSYNSNIYNINNTNTGCYINGVYTYNCNNNYYNNGWNNNYYNNNDWNNYNYNYNNGCYINGIFTYNCNNNWNNNYNYNNLSVTCYSDPSGTSNNGELVRWYSIASGGNGHYTYDWSGTEGLNSTSQNPGKIYYSNGTKYATVTVESEGYEVTRTCSVYVD